MLRGRRARSPSCASRDPVRAHSPSGDTCAGAAVSRVALLLSALIAFLGLTRLAGAEERVPDLAGATTVAVLGIRGNLPGYLFKPASRPRDVPGVVLLHGGGGNAEDMVFTARALADRGYAALALTMRAPEDAQGQDDCGAQQVADAVEALNWLARQPGLDASRLSLIGFGQGGQAALLAAARTSLPRAVVAYFPVTDTERLKQSTGYEAVRAYVAATCDSYGPGALSPLAHASSIGAAVLLIHGGADDRVPVSQSELMHQALLATGRQSELHVLPGARHDFTSAEFEHSWPWVVRFLGRHQMLSVAARDPDQQKRVNAFTEQGWASRLGARGIQTIRALGEVKREKVTLLQNPHVRGRNDEVREFFFDGLYVKALFPGRQQNAYLLQDVRITKSRYKAKYGLNLGATRAAMEEKLGPPDGVQNGFVEYFHSMGIGTARIYFQNGRIQKLEWEFRAE
jgi:dienelactone hydrolase